MKTSKLLGLGTLIVLMAVAWAPPAQAQTIPEYSTVVLTEPTDVGDTVLQPGTYLFRILPSIRNRNQVQITSVDRETIYATVMTVPHQVSPTDQPIPNTMLVYYPSIDGQPRMLRTWYAADAPSDAGHDFIYDEDSATILARAANSPVVTVRNEELYVVEPDATVHAYTVPETTVTRVTTVETQPVTVAEVETETEVMETRTELPATAGKTPLFAFAGLLALAGALAFRAVNR